MKFNNEPLGSRDLLLSSASEVMRMQYQIDELTTDRDHYKLLFEREREANDRHAKATREDIGLLLQVVLTGSQIKESK